MVRHCLVFAASFAAICIAGCTGQSQPCALTEDQIHAAHMQGLSDAASANMYDAIRIQNMMRDMPSTQ